MFRSSARKKKKAGRDDDEEGAANPSWLEEGAAADLGDSDGRDDDEGAAAESTPLISENSLDLDDADDDTDDDYGAVEVDEEDNITATESRAKQSRPTDGDTSWSEDRDGDDAAAASSGRGRRGKKSPPKKKRSTRAMMKKYQMKIEERRRRMLSGLPRRSCCHLIFVFLNIAAVSACLCMVLSQVVPLFFVQQTLLQIVLRCYITFFCVVFLVAEMELPLPFVRSSQSLHNFISKGFQYTFIAVVGMEQAQADLVEETMKKRISDPMGIEWGWFTALFVEVPAWIMLGIGVLYMLMGLFCMRPVRDRCREDYAQRMEDYFEERQAQKDKKKRDMEEIEE